MSKAIDFEKLRAPFKSSEIEWRVGSTTKDKSKGLALPYVTNRAIQNRLDEVCGIENWQNDFKEVENARICGISIRINGEWLTKWDGAQDTKKEAIKGGLSGAMKRAAVQWGMGRYLYNIPAMWVKLKPQGDSYVLAEIPKLPDWALPVEERKNIPADNWELEIQNEDLPERVQKCIDTFAKIGVTLEQITSFLNLEAYMITEKDIETLKTVYLQIRNGLKSKDDFFITYETKKRSSAATKLEDDLSKK